MVFPDEQPGYPPKRSVELGINVEEGTEPLSKPAYRQSPAELDELKTQLTLLLEKGLVRPSAPGAHWYHLQQRRMDRFECVWNKGFEPGMAPRGFLQSGQIVLNRKIRPSEIGRNRV
jgi:hypothetical protein